jgi:hypothetical protein
MLGIAKNVTQWTPNAIMQVVKHPLNTMEAYVAGHPWANTPVRQLASGVGKNIAGSVAEGALSPENALTLPYNMAAYEQAKIRANPNAPEYANNPYAMVQRGQAPTQGAAGAMNQQSAVQGMNTAGNPQPGTPQFAQLAQQYSGVAQPQTPPPASSTAAPPTSANFIGRMHELYDQYAHVKIPGLTQ